MTAYEFPAFAAPRVGSRRPRGVPGSWRIILPLLLGLAIGSATLHSVLQPGAWWPLSLIVVALVLGAAAATRWFGAPRIVGTGVGAAAGFGAMTLIFGQSTAFLGVVPTLETLRLFGRVVQQGAQQVYTQAPPADPVPELVFLVVGGMAVVAVLQDFLAFVLRVPALCGVVFLTLLAIPGGVVIGEFNVIAFVLLAAVYVWLLRGDVRLRELAESAPLPDAGGAVGGPGSGRVSAGLGLRAASLGAAAIVVSLVLPNVVPAFTETGFTSAAGVGGGALSSGRVNPMLSLGDDLRRPGNIDALSYTTDAEESLYFKLTTLSRFTGRTWAPSRPDYDPANSIDAIGPAPGVTDPASGTEVTVDVQVQGSNTRWLPAPYPAASVSGLAGNWYWEPDGLTIATTNSSTRGQDYQIVSRLPAPSREQLAAAPRALTPYLEENLELPDLLPEVISATAREVTAASGNDYERALALQDFLRSNEFRYSEQAPVDDGYDGNGMGVIARFLDERAGYCVHFSSAMAVMARTLGIPARIAVGYLPGTRTGTEDGRTVYQVGTQDLHSWPELYFEGAGWLKFEPTPGRGSLAEYASPAPVEETPDTPAPEASAAEPVAPTPAPVAEAPEAGGSAGVEVEDAAGKSLAVGVGIAVLALLFLPALARAVRRAGRRRALLGGRGSAALAWREVQDTARDLGIPVRSTDTPRAFADQIGTLPGIGSDTRASLDALRSAFERESFAPSFGSDHGPALAGWVGDVTTDLTAGASPGARVRATLAPASLLAGRPSRGLSRVARAA
ncbi:transglutaminase family protein [Planctomonas psychrotolerans]|uniref:transglutaminase family protein n=1 Tax=Planctomonas psychrotolerans TaxID=2528712 RepID=UPI00123A74B7|nr:DUF3488 and transglutaminase-like domain-containing protein [Planctomonas psychrotolerans]